MFVCEECSTDISDESFNILDEERGDDPDDDLYIVCSPCVGDHEVVKEHGEYSLVRIKENDDATTTTST